MTTIDPIVCTRCSARFSSWESAQEHTRPAGECQAAPLLYPFDAFRRRESENPKDRLGATKLPLGLFPAVAIAHGALALYDGKLKYGENNYRATQVRASIYLDAALRHLYKLYEGEDVDAESGISHAGHVLACLAIYLDAGAAGTLIDDRKYAGAAAVQALSALAAAEPQLQERHAGAVGPKHYTHQDTPYA